VTSFLKWKPGDISKFSGQNIFETSLLIVYELLKLGGQYILVCFCFLIVVCSIIHNYYDVWGSNLKIFSLFSDNTSIIFPKLIFIS